MSVNERTIDMINRSLDGELSDSEQQEISEILANSDEAKALNEELSSLVTRLESTPAEEVPEELQRRILMQIELPRPPKKWFTWAAGWMQGRPVSYGMAAGFGLLAAVAFYELSPAPAPGGDLSNMVGTLSSEAMRGQGVELASLDIATPDITGTAVLRDDGALKYLDVEIVSEYPSVIRIRLPETGIVVKGLAYESSNDQEGFLFAKDSFSFSNPGTKSFTVILALAEGEQEEILKGISVDLMQNGLQVFQNELQFE